MKILRPILVNILGVMGIVVALGFLLSAYNQYISPVTHPAFSCLGLLFPFFILANVLMTLLWMFVKWKYALAQLLVFVLGWNPLYTYCPVNFSEHEIPEKAIKVLSYNVMGPEKDADGRMGAVDYINASNADIVCLQEFHLNSTAATKALAKYRYHSTVTLVGGNTLACFSRYPIIETETVQFPNSFNGSGLFRVRVDGRDILVANNHFESNKLNDEDKAMYKDMLRSPNEEKIKKNGKHLLGKFAEASAFRSQQADIVKKVIALKGADAIIACGDFNDTPLSSVYHKMVAGLTDAYLECGNGPGISYNRSLMFFRIDNMMVSPNFKVFRCEVDRTTRASDHYPIWAIIHDQLTRH